jgi:CDP-glucose 4,6-dehydratase
MNFDFRKSYEGKKVLITGHTGFKGSWLSLWLTRLGANVYGYALEPPTHPSLFKQLDLSEIVTHHIADIRDFESLKKYVSRIKPDIVFHLAAQSVVRESYLSPAETVTTNTLGSVNVMEAVRELHLPVALVMVTSDKCYDNREWSYAYRENDPLGGRDPYSASKAGAEIFIQSWRSSFFDPERINQHGVRIASARAGNVIGGGDWTKDNLVPDCIRALERGMTIDVRNPLATRPWQHVLEALAGYLMLGSKLLEPLSSKARAYCDAFNFGPPPTSNKSVAEVVEKVLECWGSGAWRDQSVASALHEASFLSISAEKAYHALGWFPKLDFDETIRQTVEWYRRAAESPSGIFDLTSQQISDYERDDFPQRPQTTAVSASVVA